MRSSHRAVPAVALATALIALGPALAGCSSGSARPSAGPAADHTTAPPPATVPAAAGDTTVTYGATSVPGGDLMRRAAERLRARAKAFGLAGALVAVHGSTITAQAPGDTADKLRRMAATAQLTFRPVLVPTAAVPSDVRKLYTGLRCTMNTASAQPTPTATATTTSATSPAAPAAPDRPTAGCDRTTGMKYLLAPAVLDGSGVKTARARFDGQSSQWLVELEFTPPAAATFSATTAKLARQAPPANQLAIVLDGEIVSAPSIQSAIPGGSAQIAGGFTRTDAESLAALLTGGPLPIPLTVKDVMQKPR